MTQQEFAERLLVSKSTVEAIEYGRREPTSRFIISICDKFDINEHWLRTGEGEMLKPLTREAEIAKIADVMLDEVEPSARNELIKLIIDADQEDIELFVKYARKLIEALDSNSHPN